MDKEELRTDKAVEVSRKESYDLIAELLEELSDTFSTQEQEVLTKKETLNNIMPPIENNTMVRKFIVIFIFVRAVVLIPCLWSIGILEKPQKLYSM